MGILRADRITGLGGANAIKGSVEFRAAQNMRAEIVNGNADFNLGSSDFTIECWYNPSGTSGTGNSLDVDLLMLWNNSTNKRSYGLYRDSSGYLGLIGSSDGTNSDMQSYHSYNFSDVNAWYHIAAVRISNTATVYVNGTSIGSATVSGSFYENTVDNLVVGGQLAGTSYDSKIARGFISNMRLIIGDGIYTGNFTPPANELTVTPNTRLLCCQSPGNILQEATGKTLIAHRSSVNNSFAKASTFTPNSPVGFSTTTDVGSQYGTTFGDNTKFDTLSYMVPPRGNTRERGRGRALLMGGAVSPGATNTTQIKYFDIASQGTTDEFGQITVSRRAIGSVSSSTRGCAGGGFVAPTSPAHTVSDVIDYVTIATTANATDFGNMQSTGYSYGTASNETRGLFAGGYRPNNSAVVNTIDLITIASTGNASNFGDLVVARRSFGGLASPTRGIFMGGAPSTKEEIDYVTIATTGNATDFGDLLAANYYYASTSNSTRAVWLGDSGLTNTTEYVTIATTGNSIDWGDQGGTPQHAGGACSDSHGGIS